MFNGDNSSDYITRAEFNAAIESLRVVGDNQTIGVTHEPGGQVVRSIQSIANESGASRYISVTYDSGAEEFSVTITNMPFITMQSANDSPVAGTVQPYINNEPYLQLENDPSLQTLNKTFVFNKPATFAFVNIVASPLIDLDDEDLNDISLYWYASGTITGADSTTTDRLTESLYMSRIANIRLNSDGTSSITLFQDDTMPVIVGNLSVFPRIVVDSSLTRIQLTSTKCTLNVSPSLFTYALPYESDIYLAFNDTANLYLTDDISGATSYTTIGHVKIDSSGIVKVCDTYLSALTPSLPTHGYTGTFVDNGGNTITVSRGVVVSKT